MTSEVRPFRGGEDDPFRGENDRTAAMRAWLAEVESDPERRVRASTVTLQGLIGAHKELRQEVLDQIWNDLIVLEIEQELAERLDEWADRHPIEAADALAARAMQRAMVPAAVVQSAWLRELERRGGGDLDWSWLVDFGEPTFLVSLAAKANLIGYDGGRSLLPRLIELDRREALNLLKHLGLSEAGMTIEDLAQAFGAEAILRLDPPMHEEQHWAWLQLNYELVGVSALVEAERWVAQRGSPEQRIDLARWLAAEGDLAAALRVVGDLRHPLRWALLEQSGDFGELVKHLWPSRRQIDVLERLRLGRALLSIGDGERVEELLADEAGEEAFGLRLEVAAAAGESEKVAQMVNKHGPDSVVADGHLRWILFEVLRTNEAELALNLVSEHLEAAPTPQALRQLMDGELGFATRLRVLDALLLRQPTLALFKERLDGALGADRLRLLQQRALWRQRPSTACKDLEELAQQDQGGLLAFHTARRLLIRFSGAYSVLESMMRFANDCELLEETIEPVLLCASSLDTSSALELLGQSALNLMRFESEDLARILVMQMQGSDIKAPASLMAQARLQAIDGQPVEACQRLLESAVREPIKPEQIELARLAVEIGGLEGIQLRKLQSRWPEDGVIVLGCVLDRLKSGRAVDATELEMAKSLPIDGFVAAIRAGLSGNLSHCVSLLEPSAEVEALRALAIRRGLRSVLEGLKAGPWTKIGELSDWVAEALRHQAYDQALALCDESPAELSTAVLTSLLTALARGGHDDRAEVIGLRALDLGLWDEHLVEVAREANPASELFRRVLEHDACNLELIAKARAAEPGLAVDLLTSLKSALGRAAALGLDPDTTIAAEEARPLFEQAVTEIGRAPLLLRWWTDAVEDNDPELIEEAIAANPGPWAARRLLSLARRRVGTQREEARGLLQRAFALCPQDADIRRALSDLWRSEDTERAREFLAPLLEIDVPLARDLRRRARIELAEHDLEAASKSFELSGLPRRAGPMADALHAFMATGRWEQAGQWCEALIRQHGKTMSQAELGSLYADLGKIRLGLQQPVAAAASYERAITLGDERGEVLEGLGMALMSVPNRTHDGLKTLEKALPKVDPTKRVALLLLRTESIEDAWQVVDLLEAYRNEIDGHYHLIERLAQAYLQTARYDEAFAAGMRALDHAPDDRRVPMLVWIGSVAYDHLADLQRALASWNSALDIEPGHREAMDVIEAACVESEAWDLLVVNLHGQIERFGEEQAEERYQAWERVVRLAADEMQRPDLAVLGLSEMIAITDLSATRVRLAKVLGSLNRWDEVLPLLEPVWQVHGLSDEGAESLLSAYAQTSHHWRAVAVADVLQVRGVECFDREEVAQWREKSIAAMPLTAAEQTALLPPLLAGEVGEALSAAWHLLHPAIERDPQRPNGFLGRRHKRVAEEDERLAVQVFYRVARFFRQPESSLYLIPRSSDNIRVFPSKPLSIVAGEFAPVLRDDNQPALRFQIGRVLGIMRPEVALISAIGLQGLADLCSAVGLRSHRPDPTMVGHWRELLGGGLEFQLRTHLDRLAQEPVEHLAGATERLSLCSGLVACGDLRIALEEAKRSDPLHARLSEADIEELFCRLWSGSQRFVARVG